MKKGIISVALLMSLLLGSVSAASEAQTIVWQNEGIEMVPEEVQKLGEPAVIKVNVSGNTEGLQYKYVWMKDNWNEWGVIRDFSTTEEVQFAPDTAGTYKVYVDIKDLDGQITTSITDYTFMTDVWSYDGIQTDLPSPQEKYAGPITISANTSGETEHLQYKFVWMKDNWNEWGVLQPFGSSASVEWNPAKPGTYHLYVDVKDRDGKVITKAISYIISEVKWNFDGIAMDPEVVQKKNFDVTIKAQVSGNTTGLEYKFVWEKDNWKDWGVIQSFGSEAECIWKTPDSAGNYSIYVDVKDRDGKVVTKTIGYAVVSQIWNHEGVVVNEGISEQIYRELPVVAKTSGENKKLQYKFVWMKDNWESWGVIRDYVESAQATWYPKEPGVYQIYSDVRDVDGRILTQIQEYTVLDAPWTMEEVCISGSDMAFIGEETTVTAVTSGETEGLKYKFVLKIGEDWSNWKVLQDFDSNNSINIQIENIGRHTVYVDVMDSEGQIYDPYTVEFRGCTTAKNGWYYEGGYKFYYVEDEKIEDVRNIIGYQSSYVIKVNKQMSCTTIYAKDGNNGYIIPVVAFACSPGAATPTGTFNTSDKYRWHHLYGADGQFCTRITGHILFHSPPYSSFNNYTLWPREYNRLGTWASQGCVRLRTGDAKWIYDNCISGTTVIIYNSSIVGPFTKPVYEKIPLTQTWDPTDPYI